MLCTAKSRRPDDTTPLRSNELGAHSSTSAELDLYSSFWEATGLVLCVECRDDRRTGVITAMPRDRLPGSTADCLRKFCGVNVATFAT